MSEEHDTTRIIDEGDLRKYRTEIPNLIDDLALSVYAYRLYGHLKRVCGASGGACYQGTRKMARHCMMSVGMVSKAKQELRDRSLITVRTFPASANRPDEIRIVDIWPRNFAAFATRSSGEQPRSGDEQPRSRGERKKEPTRKEPTKKVLGETKKKGAERRKSGYAWLFE